VVPALAGGYGERWIESLNIGVSLWVSAQRRLASFRLEAVQVNSLPARLWCYSEPARLCLHA